MISPDVKSDSEKLRELHAYHLENHPFKKTMKLSKKERLKLGLPPNAYNEQMWELTMDPRTGRPMPEKSLQLQLELRQQRALEKGGAGDDTNPWVDRGPNNIGGRTRGIMFDPNDSTNKRVFAGGVSGGLWVNDDITDPNSSWNLVQGIGANISVTVIIYDPNDTNTFYIGSGESYTFGAAVGRGIWKSSDGGATWALIFGGFDSANGGQLVDGIFYVNDMIARNVNGNTELYASIAGAPFGSSIAPAGQFTGLREQGLYRSTDNGANWTRLTSSALQEGNGTFSNPNDLELDVNNNIWMAATRSNWSGTNSGGKIFKSTDGINFTLEHQITNARRTELEPSSVDPNKFWIAADVGGQADLFFTDDAFVNVTQLPEPNDADNGIPATDYTRGQAFYDLPIEVDSTDGTLYVGGIDLFRSTDEGQTWEQISKWSNNNNLAALDVPRIHADQHAIVFRPGNENEMVFGNDGGIYYTADRTQTQTSIEITERNKDYNTVQFYYGTMDLIDGSDGDDFAGGTQDNGTPINLDIDPGANNFFEPFGGDGGFTEIDRESGYMIQSYFDNSHRYVNYPEVTTASSITLQDGGSFINEAELDKNLDILYCNASNSSENRIEVIAEFLPGGVARSNEYLTNTLLNSSPSALKVSPFTTNSTKLFVGLRNGRLLRIQAANLPTAFYTDISGSGFVGSISDIEFGQNEDEIFVTFHNYGVNSVWFTNDGGDTWRSIEGNLPDIPVKCILQNPLLPEEVIIGTQLGVWRTLDMTESRPEWNQAYNGMSDVTVVDLDLRPSDNLILASTHGRGFFTSNFTASAASIDEVASGTKQFTVYPTVSDGNITIFANNDLGKANINIYDFSGRQVYTTKLDFEQQERNPLRLNLRSGVYILSVTSGGKQSSQKIIIE